MDAGGQNRVFIGRSVNHQQLAFPLAVDGNKFFDFVPDRCPALWRQIIRYIDKFLVNRLQNRTLSLWREVRRLYFQTAIQDAEGDSAKLWKALKCLLCNTNKKETITSINGKPEPTEISSEINKFFINIDPNLDNSMANQI